MTYDLDDLVVAQRNAECASCPDGMHAREVLCPYHRDEFGHVSAAEHLRALRAESPRGCRLHRWDHLTRDGE